MDYGPLLNNLVGELVGLSVRSRHWRYSRPTGLLFNSPCTSTTSQRRLARRRKYVIIIVYLDSQLIHEYFIVPIANEGGSKVDDSTSALISTIHRKLALSNDGLSFSHYLHDAIIHLFLCRRVAAIRPSHQISTNTTRKDHASQSAFRHAVCTPTHYPCILFHSCLFLQHTTLPIFQRVVVDRQCGTMVGKAHLLDYITHEVPLPLFGHGHDWACIFRGAPLPPLCSGASMSSRVHSNVRRLCPIFGFLAMTGQTALLWTSWVFFFHVDGPSCSPVVLCCYYYPSFFCAFDMHADGGTGRKFLCRVLCLFRCKAL